MTVTLTVVVCAVPAAGVAVIVMVYVPVVVPPVSPPPPPLELLPPPQPIAAPAITAKKSASERMRSVFTAPSAFRPRRPIGMPKKSSAAIATPPPSVRPRFSGRSSRLVVCAVVLTVRVEVSADPASVTEVGESEQVGISLAPDGLVVTAQVRLTAPV